MTDFQLKKILEMVYKIAVGVKQSGGTAEDIVNILAELADVKPEKPAKNSKEK